MWVEMSRKERNMGRSDLALKPTCNRDTMLSNPPEWLHIIVHGFDWIRCDILTPEHTSILHHLTACAPSAASWAMALPSFSSARHQSDLAARSAT
jgi:hypothetical protein